MMSCGQSSICLPYEMQRRPRANRERFLQYRLVPKGFEENLRLRRETVE